MIFALSGRYYYNTLNKSGGSKRFSSRNNFTNYYNTLNKSGGSKLIPSCRTPFLYYNTLNKSGGSKHQALL